ncbi:MAG: SURF1 family protein [Chloroflexi bacterium]|nr:SURF1 family protein [Chloroflexota bacterium]
MDSLHRLDTSGEAQTSGLTAWRALPRLLVSRQWRWVTLGVIVIMLVLIRLGMWQLDRLEQRRTNNALITSRVDEPPIQLTGQTLDAEANQYRQVLVTGTYDHGSEIVLRNRSRAGAPGMDIVTPLRIEGSDQSVLVDRGWVPLLDAEPEKRAQFAVSGPVTIRGVVRPSRVQTSSWGPQDRQPEGGRLDAWFHIDIAKIGNQVSYPLLPFYIEQLPEENAPDLPHPQPNIEITEGPHLSYAVQWFSFAAILVGGYAAFVVTRSKEQRSQS